MVWLGGRGQSRVVCKAGRVHVGDEGCAGISALEDMLVGWVYISLSKFEHAYYLLYILHCLRIEWICPYVPSSLASMVG